METHNTELQELQISPVEALVFGDAYDEIALSRQQAVEAIVATQLGTTSKAEHQAAQQAINHYVDSLITHADTHLTGVYNSLEDNTLTEGERVLSYKNEHIIRNGSDRVADAIEANVKHLHTSVIEERVAGSRFQTAFEKGRAMRFSRFLGKLVVNGPGAAAAYVGNEVITGQVDNKFIVGSILVSVFAGVRFGAPIMLKSAAQVVLGKRVEKVLKPVSPGIAETLKTTNQRRKKHDRPKLTLDERVSRIRKMETDERIDSLHDELNSEIHDWLLETSKTSLPTREQAIDIMRAALIEHISEEYGITYSKPENPEDLEI